MPSGVGGRIRKAREDAGFSQDRLAAKIGTSRRNLLRWEGGYNTPRAEHVAAIAEATGRTTDFFLNGDEEDEEADVASDLVVLLRRLVKQAVAAEVSA